MTDKSFGDHTSRNIMKNPLLSTAVTGLSIEDLTHNAVLLPVSLSQEVITSSEQQSGSQIVTLVDTENTVSNFLSGDANSSPTPLSIPPTTSTSPYNLPPSSKSEKETEELKSTFAKASVKSDDDFDVNEYFARLQGTRYVSAPLNSILKEDANAAEENLEEINLNEPEKSVEQQSLTADIAQNFSQLPTVLPQVASAVFSSFSSMLQVRKSREPTPETKSSGYQEVQFERPSEPINEYVAPREPPTMPPTVGTSNYRLPTKKKYAQIPGLSSGDSAQIPYQPSPQNMPPMSQTVPQYFVPNTAMDQAHKTPSVIQNPPPNLSPYVPPISQNDQQYFVPSAVTDKTQKTSSVSHNLPPNISQNVPIIQNIPQYFVPSSDTGHDKIPKGIDKQNTINMDSQNIASQNAPQYFVQTSESAHNQTMQILSMTETYDDNQSTYNPISQNAPTYFVPNFNDNNTQENLPVSITRLENSPSTFINTESKEASQINIRTFSPPQNIPIERKEIEDGMVDAKQKSNVNLDLFSQDHNQSVLPPPPMFTNTPRRESTSGVGKTILPPSVARRISSNQPIIKHPPQVSMITQNIFVPTTVDSINSLESISSLQTANQNPEIPANRSINQSAFAPFNLQASAPPVSLPMPPSSAISVLSGIDNTFKSSKPPLYPSTTVQKPEVLPPDKPRIFPSEVKLPPPSVFTPDFTSTKVPSSSELKSLPQTAPSMFTPNIPTAPSLISSIPQKSTEIAPPPLFTPNTQISQVSILTPSFETSTQGSLSPLPTPTSLTSLVPPVKLYTPNSGAQPYVSAPSALPLTEIKRIKTNDEIAAPYVENTQPVKVPEPPKATGNVNFRMTKKKPQYYAGPIEGIGAISNNVKPVIPSVNLESFQGALFTPQVDFIPQPPTVHSTGAVPFDISCPLPTSKSIDAATVPFDISRPVQLAEAMHAPFDISRPAEPTHPIYEIQGQVSDYNTPFDTSRKTTETYNESKPDSSGFGLLGSLKSKLSSIDINKIQSSVTTFFDPAYNEPKKEVVGEQYKESFEQSPQQYSAPYGQYGRMQGNNFEIFVPQIEQATEAYNQTFNYQTPLQNQYTYGQESQYYQTQNACNYYQNTDENVANYFSQTPQSYQSPTNTNQQEIHPLTTDFSLQDNVHIGNSTANLQTETKQEPIICSQQYSNKESIDLATPAVSSQYNAQEAQNESYLKDNYTALPPYQHQESLVKDLSVNEGTIIYGEKTVAQSQSETIFFETPQTNLPQYESKGLENEEEIITPLSYLIAPTESNAILEKNFEFPHTKELQISTQIEKDSLLTKTESPFSTQKLSLTDSSMRSFFDTSKPSLPLTLEKNIQNIAQNIPIGCQSNILDKDAKFHNPASFIDGPTTNVEHYQINKDDHDLKLHLSPNNDVLSIIADSDLIEQKPQYNLFPQSNPTDFFAGSSGTKTQGLFANFTLTDNSPIKLFQQEDTEKQDDYIRDAPQLGMSSAPLFGLSTMLADKTKELNDLEDEIKRNAMQTAPEDIEDLLNQADKVTFFQDLEARHEKVEPDNENVDDKDEVPDLNICETCREMTKHDDKEKDDLTTKLIENITSPIQLLNPVGVPLSEGKIAGESIDDYESKQCSEISHITEETRETIQVQSANEMLEDEEDTRKYGWSEDQDINYTTSFQSNIEHGYSLPGLPIDPNAIGFFGGNPLFGKMKITKEEQKTDHKDTSMVLPRQISIPSAPAEDDVKSEGIDVHSIEQDANKDFPVFEEFVIEPDQSFKESCESIHDLDSFTSRVDKYKKNENDPIEKTSPVFDLKSATSPSIHMASYFDTGNYAVETHYRNSLTSPTNHMRVPPGFEDEFQKRLSIQNSGDKNDIPFIPDTSTQTRPIYSPTFSTAQNIPNSTCITASKLSGLIPKVVKSQKLPDFSNVFKQEGIRTDIITNFEMSSPTGAPKGTVEEVTTSSDLLQIKKNVEPTVAVPAKKLPDIDIILGISKELDKSKPSIFEEPISKPKEVAQKPLQDHINFFSSNVNAPDKSAGDQDFNRLASYFSSPAKTDHPKSFFELSQGQNHYRQEPKTDLKSNIDKGFLPESQIENSSTNIHSIPPQQYLANLNLINDLASYQNAEFKPEHTVKTVNYFTIKYDNESFAEEFNKGEPKLKKEPINNNIHKVHLEAISNDKTYNRIVEDCKHCCNFDVGPISKLDSKNLEVLTNFKVRKCMDTNSESKKDNTMEPSKQDDKNRSVSVNFGDQQVQEDAHDEVTVLNVTENRSSAEYTPVKHHWFYRIDVEEKSTWRGFSVVDSKALEDAWNNPSLDENTVVATDGGRYDVNVKGRLRIAVYWAEKPANVRRCSWFYKGTTDARYVPYSEAVADKLEEEYRHGMTTGEWHRRLVLPNSELVVMHGPGVMVHFVQAASSDAFSTPPLFAFGKRVYRNPPKMSVTRNQQEKIDHLIMMVHGAGEFRVQKEKIQSTIRPRVVRRGCDECEIEEVEPSNIDHLLLLCHGVGSACDMRFRAVEEVVDDFRATSLQLIQSHYRNSYDNGVVGRVEVLPISWHTTLHSGETGVDRRLARITLDSIPRLRSFTNDTVLDVLFYTSPVYCQTIINTVCSELNRIYKLFRQRNPDFKGRVSLGGHSLGSVILYDLLCHQSADLKSCPAEPAAARDKRYVSGAAGTGQPCVVYPALDFSPVAMYALGSPIAIFECIRGVDSLGTDFALPTCQHFFNIFHPYDPIAYRIEPLLNPQLRNVKPFLIPHHKGRKRMHLELKDTMARVGADIKQKLVESIKNTWSSMWKSQPPPSDQQLEKVVEEEMEKEQLTEEGNEEIHNDDTTPEMLGKLNNGRRVDYVLQEAPFEMINEYLFAMSSHVCYWESEDTMLLMLREIYDGLGVQPDCTVPQNSLTVQRTRLQPPDETIVMNASEHPSTSRGSTS